MERSCLLFLPLDLLRELEDIGCGSGRGEIW